MGEHGFLSCPRAVWRKPKARLLGSSQLVYRIICSGPSQPWSPGCCDLFAGYRDTGAKRASPWVSRCLAQTKLLAMALGTSPYMDLAASGPTARYPLDLFNTCGFL